MEVPESCSGNVFAASFKLDHEKGAMCANITAMFQEIHKGVQTSMLMGNVAAGI